MSGSLRRPAASTSMAARIKGGTIKWAGADVSGEPSITWSEMPTGLLVTGGFPGFSDRFGAVCADTGIQESGTRGEAKEQQRQPDAVEDGLAVAERRDVKERVRVPADDRAADEGKGEPAEREQR